MTEIKLSNGDSIILPDWFYRYFAIHLIVFLVDLLTVFRLNTKQEIKIVGIESSAEHTNLSAGREAD